MPPTPEGAPLHGQEGPLSLQLTEVLLCMGRISPLCNLMGQVSGKEGQSFTLGWPKLGASEVGFHTPLAGSQAQAWERKGAPWELGSALPSSLSLAEEGDIPVVQQPLGDVCAIGVSSLKVGGDPRLQPGSQWIHLLPCPCTMHVVSLPRAGWEREQPGLPMPSTVVAPREKRRCQPFAQDPVSHWSMIHKQGPSTRGPELVLGGHGLNLAVPLGF